MQARFQLEIPKRNVNCFQHGARLLPGMEIYSLILENEEQQLIRRDFCSVCWIEVQMQEILNIRVYWKSKIESKEANPKSTRVERALNLLNELLQAQDPSETEIFVLCLFLAHARQITLRQEFKKEQWTYQLYEISRQERYLTVKVLNLTGDQIEIVQQSLAKRLNIPLT